MWTAQIKLPASLISSSTTASLHCILKHVHSSHLLFLVVSINLIIFPQRSQLFCLPVISRILYHHCMYVDPLFLMLVPLMQVGSSNSSGLFSTRSTCLFFYHTVKVYGFGSNRLFELEPLQKELEYHNVT